MPTSRRPSTPPADSSQEDYSRLDSRRVRGHSTRPDTYSVAHLPRHVTPAVVAEIGLQSERKAKIKRRLRLKRRLTSWELAGFAVSSVACAFLLSEINRVQGDFRQMLARVQEKQAHYHALDKQRVDEKNSLAHLKSKKGRDQLLAERGYLQSGDRILLFPSEEKVSDTSQP